MVVVVAGCLRWALVVPGVATAGFRLVLLRGSSVYAARGRGRRTWQRLTAADTVLGGFWPQTWSLGVSLIRLGQDLTVPFIIPC